MSDREAVLTQDSRQDLTSIPEDHRAALIASFVGWTLDAFDFFLVTFCLTSIGKEFHQSDAKIALSLTVTLAFRPVGAIVIGLWADRYGRRLPFMINVLFYSVAEIFTGLVHGYTSFMVLRALFGMGMGGQWGVERRSPWKRSRRENAAPSQDYCKKVTQSAVFLQRPATFLYLSVGDGALYFSSVALQHCCWSCSFTFA